MSNWSEIRFPCPVALIDAVSSALWESGCCGVTEGQSVGGKAALSASFEDLAPQSRARVETACLEVIRRGCETASVSVTFDWREIPLENWKETHRRFYPPQALSSRFFLVPAWQAHSLEVPPGFLSIVMEPGRAFGTGLHQSTRLALWLMEEYLTEASGKDPGVLDVGTGSGILAIAAKKMGEQNVAGIDNDPEAVEVAVENARANQTDSIEFSTKNLQQFPTAAYGVVVSNILLRTHHELLPGYKHVTKRGGVLILSGLLQDQRLDLEPELKRLGFVRNRSKIIDEWEAAAYLLK